MLILLRAKSLRGLQVVVALALVGLGWVASARARPFVYATNINNDSVSQYDAAHGALSPLAPATVSTSGDRPLGIAVSPNGREVYVGIFSDSPTVILRYSVGPSGALTLESTTTAPAVALAESLAVSPNGKSLYVVDRFGPDSLLQHTVQADGSLTPKSPPSVAPTGSGPEDVAVSADSRSVYATNDDGTVSQYTAAADGTLSPKSPPTVPTDSQSAEPFGVAVSPFGKSAYVANYEAFANLNGSISQFSIGANGALSPKSPPSVTASGHPEDLVVSPDGRNVYATNPNPPSTAPGTVLQYSVAKDGTLTPKSPPAVVAGFAPFGITISADGRSVYAADENSNAVSQYTVGAFGALSPRSPATVPAGGSPYQIAVSPPVRIPIRKQECNLGGWLNFPQFGNEGDCLSSVQNGD